jgi:hypothetical protein
MRRTSASSSTTSTVSPCPVGAPSLAAVTIRPTAVHAGRWIFAEVPSPGSEYNRIRPPASVTIPYAVASPSPVPLPLGFVVKNGSNARSRTSAPMPTPESLTVSRT